MAIQDDLIRVGLHEKEAQTYLALLELGPSSIVSISKKAGLKRTTIYEIIESLKEKRLVSETAFGKRKRFIAEPPETFFNIKKQELETLRKMLPTLDALRNVAIEKPALKFYQGAHELKAVFEDMCLTTDPIDDKLLGIETKPNVLLEKTVAEFWIHLLAKKKERGLESLTLDTLDKAGMEKFAKEHPYGFDHGLQVKLLEDKKGQFNINVYLYQNKTALIAEDQLFALVIENKRLKESMEFLFYKLWDRAEPVKLTSEAKPHETGEASEDDLEDDLIE